MSDKLTRKAILTGLVVLPALAATMLMPDGALAASNKAQYKYQNKPGKAGEKCSQCRFFKPPHGCSIVTGTISPTGWCIAWSKK